MRDAFKNMLCKMFMDSFNWSVKSESVSVSDCIS